ncbi:hypothetical protein LY76DRAFT_670483 [Colletotrichum caudatum]|nr:hypothetical protein LY76DRAFT_670483 [Colletotrichum caudatum]
MCGDIESEDIIRISSKRLGDNRPVIDHISDDTFTLLGPREQAHAMLDKIIRHTPEFDGSVLSRRSLDAALEKWSAWGKPDIKLKLLVGEMEALEPRARSVELLVIQQWTAKNPGMTVSLSISMLSTGQRYYYNQIAKQGKMQAGKDTIRYNLLVHFWSMSINPSLSPRVSLRSGPDDTTFPWNKMRPSNMESGPDPSYKSFLQWLK